MADLFKDSLDSLQLADVLGFLALSAPETQRPTEGTLLDFKRDLIPDIGFYIAALANTSGGLIFIGVDAQKSASLRQNIPTSAPGCALGADAKARITNKIVTGVSPRPRFEIGVYPVVGGTAEGAIGVIRVEPGDYPPYEYSKSGDYKIPMRIQDTTRQASLREIEELLRNRDRLQTSAEKLLSRYIASDLLPKANNRQSLFVSPMAPLRLRLDSSSEASFKDLLLSAFHGIGQTSDFRRGSFYRVCFEKKRCAAIWSDGALAFTADLSRRGHPGEYVGDIIDELLYFCRAAAEFYNRNHYFGQLVLTHEIQSTPLALLPQRNGMLPYTFRSMTIPTPSGSTTPKVNRIDRVIDLRFLEHPSEIGAQIMLEQLRDIWQASVKYSMFLEELKAGGYDG